MKKILFSFLSILAASAIKAPPNAGCLGGDLPSGTSPFYDHSSVIKPYTSEDQISFSAVY